MSGYETRINDAIRILEEQAKIELNNRPFKATETSQELKKVYIEPVKTTYIGNQEEKMEKIKEMFQFPAIEGLDSTLSLFFDHRSHLMATNPKPDMSDTDKFIFVYPLWVQIAGWLMALLTDLDVEERNTLENEFKDLFPEAGTWQTNELPDPESIYATRVFAPLLTFDDGSAKKSEHVEKDHEKVKNFLDIFDIRKEAMDQNYRPKDTYGESKLRIHIRGKLDGFKNKIIEIQDMYENLFETNRSGTETMFNIFGEHAINIKFRKGSGLEKKQLEAEVKVFFSKYAEMVILTCILFPETKQFFKRIHNHRSEMFKNLGSGVAKIDEMVQTILTKQREGNVKYRCRMLDIFEALKAHGLITDKKVKRNEILYKLQNEFYDNGWPEEQTVRWLKNFLDYLVVESLFTQNPLKGNIGTAEDFKSELETFVSHSIRDQKSLRSVQYYIYLGRFRKIDGSDNLYYDFNGKGTGTFRVNDEKKTNASPELSETSTKDINDYYKKSGLKPAGDEDIPKLIFRNFLANGQNSTEPLPVYALQWFKYLFLVIFGNIFASKAYTEDHGELLTNKNITWKMLIAAVALFDFTYQNRAKADDTIQVTKKEKIRILFKDIASSSVFATLYYGKFPDSAGFLEKHILSALRDIKISEDWKGQK